MDNDITSATDTVAETTEMKKKSGRHLSPAEQLAHIEELRKQLTAKARAIKAREDAKERKARALAFLKQNTVMRVGDYARITGLSHTKAAELKNLCSDDSLGITSEGTYGSKVFFLKTVSG